MSPSISDRLLMFCVLAIILLGIAWELWLAPLRPGGSFLVLKVVPLILLAPGLWRGARRSKQILSMLILLYVTEGVVRAMTDKGLQAQLGAIELALASAAFFICLAGFYKARR
jgi:uncharacterized membrane protein